MLSTEEKVAGMIMSAVACTVLAVVGVVYGSPILLNMAYSFGGIFGLLIGQPITYRVRSVLKALAKDNEEK